jgi:hypothetical protein
MNTLYSARQSDEEAHSLAECHFSEECHEMEEEISTFPPALLRVLSPRLAAELLQDLIDPLITDITVKDWFGRNYWSACKVIFRSVLNRFIQKFDPDTTSNWFGQLVILENLDSVPHLEELAIPYYFELDRSELLASMIHHVTNLRTFKCPRYCNDEIILQLRLHCPNLTHVDFAYSREVTNTSARHLMELKKLNFLGLSATQIDVKHYGLILSHLPHITNVIYNVDGDDILAHIAAEKLDSITHIRGSFPNIHALSQKFPNTTDICLYCICIDHVTGKATKLTELSAFSALRALETFHLPYDTSEMSAVLLHIGSRLTDLKLNSVTGINLHEIVTLCPSLLNLSLTECSYSHSEHNTHFDCQLPHFRNLINLELRNFGNSLVGESFIRNYVNLKTIYLACVNVFTDEFVRQIISLGTLTKLEVLHIQELWPGALTEEGLQLLIRHCPLLKRIEGLGYSAHFNYSLIEQVNIQMFEQNYDLVLQQ